MTSVCLLRHGETDWNALGKLQGKTDIPLNQNGVKQAEESRAYLKDFEWDLIITSPLKRAKSTAEIINQDLDLQLVEMEDFIERSFGEAEGLTKEERNTQFPKGNYPNMETREELQKRIQIGIDKIRVNYSDKKVLLVAHGAVINAILTLFSDGQIGSDKTLLLNACISNIEYVEEKWQVHDYNQVSHLSQYKEKNKQKN